jgi:dynein heavy chain
MDLLLFIYLSYSRARLPQEWADRLDDFQKIICVKCLRPDKVTNAMQDFVSKHLGQKFIEPQVCISTKNDTLFI